MAQGFNVASDAATTSRVATYPHQDPPALRTAAAVDPFRRAPGPGAKPESLSPTRGLPQPRRELPTVTACTEQQHQMRVLVDQAPHLIMVYALHDGSVRYANAAAGVLLGRQPEDLVGVDIFDLLELPDSQAADPRDNDPDEPTLLPGEYAAQLSDGAVHYLDVRSAPVVFDGVPCGHVVAWDVTTRVERERDLIRQASYDELTGLPNAAHAFVYLEQSLRRLERNGNGCVAVILLDLDGFKQVNDTHGHQIGDALLQCTAERIRCTTRDTDLAARLHGDEFLVVQSVANPIHAAYVSERLRTTLARPIDLEGLTVKVSASVGVAVADPGTSDPHHLLQFADHRMYTDKQRRGHQR